MTIGSRSAVIEAQQLGNKIGLLIPEQGALAAKHGAELAIREANEKRGYREDPFHLAVRSSGGPWGAGSKESVGLIFDDEVVAIMGSLDGRNAHLAEQVAAKTKILFLSAWAGDMTLSQAYVPWYFRCVPNDEQQSIALIREIYQRRKITRVAVIGTEDYDSRNAVRTFVRTAASMEIPIAKQYMYRLDTPDFQEEMTDIGQSDIEAVVLLGKPVLVSEIIPMMKQKHMNQPLFGSMSVMDFQGISPPLWNLLEGVTLVSSGHWFTEKGIAFQKTFQASYGYQPGPVAAYAYDGMSLIIDVIKNAGADRDRIIHDMAGMGYLNGVTGEIRFEADGNRTGIPGLMTVNNGIPVSFLYIVGM